APAVGAGPAAQPAAERESEPEAQPATAQAASAGLREASVSRLDELRASLGKDKSGEQAAG
ncbi:MAG: hypothetical protein J2P15_13260, partial [Micromonosporaceae bacterium]|nr:hypothetical protein [Micromonosporaceae bacterium]